MIVVASGRVLPLRGTTQNVAWPQLIRLSVRQNREARPKSAPTRPGAGEALDETTCRHLGPFSEACFQIKVLSAAYTSNIYFMRQCRGCPQVDDAYPGAHPLISRHPPRGGRPICNYRVQSTSSNDIGNPGIDEDRSYVIAIRKVLCRTQWSL